MLRHHLIATGYRALNLAGILSEDSYALLQRYPAAGEILQHMADAGICQQPVVENELLFANVVHVCKEAEESTLEELLQLYRLLGKNSKEGSLLTHEIHENILTTVMPRSLTNIIKILTNLPRLTSAALARFTGAPESYAKLYTPSLSFDFSQKSFIYLLNAPIERYFINQFSESLHKRFQQKEIAWLNPPLFQVMVDKLALCKSIDKHMNTGYYLVDGLATLHSFGLFNEYQQRFLENVAVGSLFSTMRYEGQLDAETAALAIANPAYGKAKRVCEQLGIARKNRKEFNLTLLKDPLLSEGLALLKKPIDKVCYDYDRDFTPFVKDAEQLIACATKQHDSNTLFKPAEAPSLKDCVAALKAKYAPCDPECVRPGI